MVLWLGMKFLGLRADFAGCLQFLAAPLPNLLILRTHVAVEARVHTASEAVQVLSTESQIKQHISR